MQPKNKDCLCWGCARLGKCPHANKHIIKCKKYLDYHITKEKCAEMLGISLRTFFRWWVSSRELVLNKLKAQGLQLIVTKEGKKEIFIIKAE